MFAVIKTGGKQYRVAPGDEIAVEKLKGEAGAKVEISDVLMIGEDGKAPTVGTPVIEKATMAAEVVEQTRGEKIIVFKKKRRHNYRRKKGHRQDLTVLRITDINAGGKKAASKAKAAPKKEAAAEAKAEAQTDAPAEAAKSEE